MLKNISLTRLRCLAQGGFLALVLQLLAMGGAWAQSATCAVALVSVSNNQAFLKANCTAAITSINWLRGTPTPATMTGDLTIPSLPASTGNPATDVFTFFNAPLLSGINTFTVTGNLGAYTASNSVTVITPPPQAVTGVASPSAGGSVVCSSPVSNGSTSTCTITTNAGYTLGGVSTSACNGSLSGNVYTTGSITTACTVTASFSATPTYTVTGVATPSAGGSVTCTTPVNSGSTSTCAVTTTSGYTLTGVTSNTCGGPFSGNSFSTGTVTSPCTVTATFTQSPTSFQVTGVASPSNGGTVTCTSPVNQNSSTTCAVSANSGWTVTGTTNSTCGGSLFANSTSGTYTTGVVTSACTVTVNFSQSSALSFTLSGVATPPAGGSISCNSPIASGATGKCSINVNSGYTVTASSTCGGSLGTLQSWGGYDFITGIIISPCTVTATFSSSGGGGTASCGSGETFDQASGDADWNPLSPVQIFPLKAITASGNSGRAIRFVANNTLYPNGAYMEAVDQTPQLLPKDIVISTCPHNFTPVNDNKYCAQTFITDFSQFFLRFGVSKVYYDCALNPGETYYLNFRDSRTPRGTVSSQFDITSR